MTERTYWTVSELAGKWNVSKSQIRKWIDADVLPAYQVDGWMIRIKATDVDAFEAQNFRPVSHKAHTPTATPSPSTHTAL